MANSKTLLIDGDILLFKFAFRHQKTVTWADGEDTVILDPERAKYDTDVFIKDLVRRCGCVDYLICFTSKFNFRYQVLPTYKQNRANSVPPQMIKIIKDHIRFTHPWQTQDWLEADDLMGIMGSRNPGKYVLASIDKDFQAVPCWLFLWNKNWKKPHRISQDEADFWFHYQWLCGDAVDGYKGVFRVGDKKARKILDCDPSEYTDVVLETYMDKCYSYKECLQQARMARILRHTDYNQQTNEVILWEPK